MRHPILVIDDDTDTCQLLEESLRERFDVAWTTEPDAALELSRQRAFSVVLTDVRMQRIDGIELCAKLVADQPALPVVVMTAFGSIDTAVSAMRAGASDFLMKPLELGEVAATFERVLERAAVRPPASDAEVAAAGVELAELVALEEIERRYILRVLAAVRGNKSRAAQVLGLDRKTLYRRLERYGMSPDGSRTSA